MRTLKKTLALVLVVAMMMSLCITSNAAFTDADKIEYTEAVDVLTKIGVIDGFPAGDFQPQGSLTRAQAAKILVYILGAEDYAKADGQIFDDVKEGHWAADYIAYCAENKLVNGYGDGNFGPEDELTAYQWAKMLLAALGVDTTEMIGAAWQIPVATAAAKYDIFAGNLKADKTEICTREEACLYALNALNYGVGVKGYAVYDVNGDVLGYYGSAVEAAAAAAFLNEANDIASTATAKYTYSTVLSTYTNSLLLKAHGVTRNANYADIWGRPGVSYNHKYWASALAYTEDPINTYTVKVSDCDLAVDLGYFSDDTVVTYTNGVKGSSFIDVDRYAADNGAQGTLIEVYDGRLVIIETYLAEVDTVVPVVLDKNGHLVRGGYSTLKVWTGDNTQTSCMMGNTSYAKGDMILVNHNAAKGACYAVSLAPSFVGAQDTIWFNADQHTVNGTVYNDAVKFYLNEAEYQTTDHTWYMDQYGNLIGVEDIDTVYAYGVLTSLYWVNDGSNYGAGAAYGTITYMDGTSSAIVEIAEINTLPTTYARNTGVGPMDKEFAVSTYGLDNAAYLLNDLFRIETQADGSLLLVAQPKTADADNDIATGVSKVYGETLYADNNTQYLTYNPVTKQFASVTGYDNIADYEDIQFSYVLNANGTFMKYVYIKAAPAAAEASDYVFITNQGASVSLKKIGGVNYFSVSGVVRADGSTEAVLVAADAAGTADDTLAALQAWLRNGVGKLYAISTSNGYVKTMLGIQLVTETPVSVSVYDAEYEGIPTNYTENGVLVVDGKYYNVNAATTIVTAAGVGTTADLTAAVVNGKYVYVVYPYYAPTTAVAVFVTDVAGTNVGAALDAAKAAKLAEIAAVDTLGFATAKRVENAIAAAEAAVEAAETVAAVNAVDVSAIADAAASRLADYQASEAAKLTAYDSQDYTADDYAEIEELKADAEAAIAAAANKAEVDEAVKAYETAAAAVKTAAEVEEDEANAAVLERLTAAANTWQGFSVPTGYEFTDEIVGEGYVNVEDGTMELVLGMGQYKDMNIQVEISSITQYADKIIVVATFTSGDVVLEDHVLTWLYY